MSLRPCTSTKPCCVPSCRCDRRALGAAQGNNTRERTQTTRHCHHIRSVSGTSATHGAQGHVADQLRPPTPGVHRVSPTPRGVRPRPHTCGARHYALAICRAACDLRAWTRSHVGVAVGMLSRLLTGTGTDGGPTRAPLHVGATSQLPWCMATRRRSSARCCRCTGTWSHLCGFSYAVSKYTLRRHPALPRSTRRFSDPAWGAALGSEYGGAWAALGRLGSLSNACAPSLLCTLQLTRPVTALERKPPCQLTGVYGSAL